MVWLLTKVAGLHSTVAVLTYPIWLNVCGKLGVQAEIAVSYIGSRLDVHAREATVSEGMQAAARAAAPR